MLSVLAEERLLAVVRAEDADSARRAAEALIAGGIKIVELTLTTPGVLPVVGRLRESTGDDVVVGVGTVRDPQDALAAAEAGAQFLVSPHAAPPLVDAMLATGVPALPGALTPTEVAGALAAGASVVKLFPAATVGPAHLRALRGPFPELTVVPTGGVDLDRAPAWLSAGAVAIGAGSELLGRGPIDPDALEQRVAEWRAAIDELPRPAASALAG
jgi:2-dehydro-3-deoxyphosphogluconate aldolase/(4S)-4-hydroxy-2-oxoglutarate aldolase